jgi:hypothetical protein
MPRKKSASGTAAQIAARNPEEIKDSHAPQENNAGEAPAEKRQSCLVGRLLVQAPEEKAEHVAKAKTHDERDRLKRMAKHRPGRGGIRRTASSPIKSVVNFGDHAVVVSNDYRRIVPKVYDRKPGLQRHAQA